MSAEIIAFIIFWFAGHIAIELDHRKREKKPSSKNSDTQPTLPLCGPSRKILEFDFTSKPKDPIDELMEDIRRERRENVLNRVNTLRFHYPAEEMGLFENITEETLDYGIDDLHLHEDLEISKNKKTRKTKYPRYFE